MGIGKIAWTRRVAAVIGWIDIRCLAGQQQAVDMGQYQFRIERGIE